MTDSLHFEIADGIATITLNRPERMNAFTWEMIDAWAAALLECKRDDAVRVVIVTGAGKAFCSGGDINWMGERADRPPGERKDELWAHVQRIPLAYEDLDKPVLVAVNGVATGAGMDLALMGDIRYAAASARFAETYVKVGLVPGAGGAHFLPRLIGVSRALELFWTGDFISAAEAERIGLVNKVFPDAELMEGTYAFARKVAAGAPLAVQTIKRVMRLGLDKDLGTALDIVASSMPIVRTSEDHQEAVAAFKEKRTPRFKGQ